MSDKEITLTSAGVVLKGDVVDDVRPVVKRAVTAADAIMRLANNLITLPLDYASNNLERLRQTYIERFEEIPVERRQEPSERIGYSVLREAAFSADEPDLQDLFANLLASASDSATAEHVHPGFVSIIGELRGLEARILRDLARDGISQISFFQPCLQALDPDARDQALSNLVRLGLLDWKETPYQETDLRKFVGRDSYGSFIDPTRIPQLVLDLVNDFQRFKNELIRELRSQHQRQRLEVTAFGRSFLLAAIREVPLGPLRTAGLSNADLEVFRLGYGGMLERDHTIYAFDGLLENCLSRGLSESEIAESTQIIADKSLWQVSPTLGPHKYSTVQATMLGLEEYCKSFVAGYSNLESEVGRCIVGGETEGKEIAKLVGCPEIVIDHVLEMLDQKDYIRIIKSLAGVRVLELKPQLRRHFDQSAPS